jgi:two-component system sensor histidine kinase CpxA
MRPAASLFTKILAWFFLNMVLVAVVLAFFFIFQQQINLRALFGRQGADRMRPTGMLIAHDLSLSSQADWVDILSRHALVHKVDFTILLPNGTYFSSTNDALPPRILIKARRVLRQRLPKERRMSRRMMENHQRPQAHARPMPPGQSQQLEMKGTKFSIHPAGFENLPYFRMRTRNPTRYWSALRIPLQRGPGQPPAPAILLAVSNSFTGNGFFFDPLPWIVVAGVVILISVLVWIPMVRHITRPLARMTGATEKIAGGDFDVAFLESRSDEIGRLAKAISHMTARLSALVQGQKRFLGDVAHELGSPLARIQFGLGALEQRVAGESRERVEDVMEDVDHLSKLVNELLAFSRADINSSTVKLETVRLLPIVQTAVERERTPSADISIDVDADIRVLASNELLTRALANLVRNAIKYAGNAGPIILNAQKDSAKVTLVVRDNGPGVPADLLDQLFEPFFRPQLSRDSDSGGVGLGLAIVKTCVETCKGTVSAANLQPRGFAVSITISLA